MRNLFVLDEVRRRRRAAISPRLSLAATSSRPSRSLSACEWTMRESALADERPHGHGARGTRPDFESDRLLMDEDYARRAATMKQKTSPICGPPATEQHSRVTRGRVVSARAPSFRGALEISPERDLLGNLTPAPLAAHPASGAEAASATQFAKIEY